MSEAFALPLPLGVRLQTVRYRWQPTAIIRHNPSQSGTTPCNARAVPLPLSA